MKKTGKRITSFLAVITMTAALLPAVPQMAVSVYADEGDPAITLGSDILAKNVNGDGLQNVWFGEMTDGNPAKWNVIGYNGSGNEVAAKEGVMTLLCGQNIEDSPFRDDTWDNVYAGSVLDTRLTELGAAMFDADELTYTSTRTLEGGSENYDPRDPSDPEYHGGYDPNKVKGDTVNNVLLWPLSYAEASLLPGFLQRSGAYWWLRSPGTMDDRAAFVGPGGAEQPGTDATLSYGVRPAFDLLYTDILLATAATGGKVSGETNANALTEVGDNTGNDWKLTLKDPSRSGFTAEAGDLTVATMNITYSGAVYGENEFVSAIITDSSGQVKYYGRVASLSEENLSEGSVSVNLAGKCVPGDKLYVFNEQMNGDSRTDYSSELVEIALPSIVGIDKVDLTVTPPECGTEVTTESYVDPMGMGIDWDWANQTNKPEAALPDNAKYAFPNETDSCVWIYIDPVDDSRCGLNAVLTADKSYLADIYLAPDENYYFTESTEVTAEGAEVSAVRVDGETGFIHIRLSITPVHDWMFTRFTWTGNDTDGYTAAEAMYTCTMNSDHTSGGAENTETSVPAAVSEEDIEADGLIPGKTVYTAFISAEDSPDGMEHSDTRDAKAVYSEAESPALNLGSDILAKDVNTDNMQVLWFGGKDGHDAKDWYVIGYNGNGNSAATREGVVTLLRKGFDGNCKFKADPDDPDLPVPDYDTDYGDSDLKKYLDDIRNSDIFSTAEKQTFALRKLQGGNVMYDQVGHNDTDIGGSDVYDALWPLSVAMAWQLPESIRYTDREWWLSTPGGLNDVAYVSDDNVNGWGHQADCNYGVKEGCDINIKKIVLTSAIDGGKTSGDVGVNALYPVGTNDSNEWKATIKDEAHSSFTVSDIDTDFAPYIQYQYSGAVPGDFEFLSAIITDSSGNIKYYGQVAHVTKESDYCDFSIAGKFRRGDKLYVFTEKINANWLSDYSSDLIEIPVPDNMYISRADLTVTPPACGTEVATPSEPFPFGPGTDWKWAEQTPKPQVELNGGGDYVFSERDDSCVWIDMDPLSGERRGLNETMIAGQKYQADIILTPDSIYRWDDKTDVYATGADVVSHEIDEDGNMHIRIEVAPVHNMKEVPDAAATCTKDGVLSHYECKGCGKWFLDDAGETEITDHSSIMIPALGHDWGAWKVTKKPTLSAEGEKQRVCGRCDKVQIKPVDKLINIKNAKVTLSKTSYTYNGTVQRPAIKSVTLSGKTLKEGTDYTAKWSKLSSKNAGTYTVTLTGKGVYGGTVKASYKINKAANPMKVSGKAVTVSYNKLKTASRSLERGKVIIVSKPRGTVTYAKVKGNDKIIVGKKTGNILVKKGLGKGTYKVKVAVRAAGTENYKASSEKTVTVTITVK